ncbi:MAG TPA: transcription antitermination factor NusB [Thermoanaerobaculia bacterium]|nr:transcription antitermination factor NusB [Thermoanaerobaculia bacterium]
MGARQRPPDRTRRLTPRRSPEDNVRAAAAWVLERTLAASSPVELFLRGALERFDERDQALLRELVLGTLRWLRRLDDVLVRASNRRLADIDPALHATLRIGAYQLLFLERVPPYAAVDEAVEQAQGRTHRGGASFVNAVLRRVARDRSLDAWPVDDPDPVRRLAIEASHPDFLVRRWLDRFGEARTRLLLAANNRPKAMQLLAFRDRGGREMLAERLIDEGLEVEPTRLSPLGLTVRQGNPLTTAAFRDGDCYVQDEASQAAALLPPPRAGERVLDAAAAPGGKTFALLAAEPGIRATVADAGLARLSTLRQNLRRLRRPLAALAADAAQPPFIAAFDRVVLDLPCSGTGTLRKNPELKWRLSESEIGRLAAQGERLLAQSAALLAPGGVLVAITCSLEAEENEQVAERYLAAHPAMRARALAEHLEPALAAGIEAPGRWRVLPAGDHDGFTVQVFARA